ncbi:DUF6090 family protein [Balneola sp. MJW-20]|uniref:DUF6090 family protein n=1 Tax=Gracilimonas aurantiaca TaxID=3234185 RepID=UPI0034658FC9
MKYAFGEIALIMVGILLALQVNNWNEERIIQHRIQSRLESLKHDLQADVKEMNDILNATSRRLSITSMILKNAGILSSLNEGDNFLPYEEKDPSETNGILSTLKTVDGNRHTYNSLIGAGEFYLIKNRDLASRIQDYYARVDEVMEQEYFNNQQSWLTINKSKQRLGIGITSREGSLEKLTEMALSDRQFAAELESLLTFDRFQLNTIKELKSEAETLIAALND